MADRHRRCPVAIDVGGHSSRAPLDRERNVFLCPCGASRVNALYARWMMGESPLPLARSDRHGAVDGAETSADDAIIRHGFE